jgi:polar amino acid transport system substrate-binding protein
VDRSSLSLRSVALGASLVAVLAGGAAAQSPSAPAASPVVVPSFGPIAGLTAPTTLITPGTITDCVDIEYKPMEYFPTSDVTDENQAIGFDVDGARAVAAALGLQLAIKNTAFDSLIPDLGAGRCDIVWTALYISDKRLEVGDAVPYLATGQQIMVPAGNPKGIKSLDDLCGLTVSIQSGGVVEARLDTQSTACTAAGKAAIVKQGYPKVADEYQQIVLGRVDAIWETDTAIKEWMTQYPGLYEVAYSLPKDVYGIYFTKGAADLGASLTAAITALNANGTLPALAAKYGIDPATLDTSSK